MDVGLGEGDDMEDTSAGRVVDRRFATSRGTVVRYLAMVPVDKESAGPYIEDIRAANSTYMKCNIITNLYISVLRLASVKLCTCPNYRITLNEQAQAPPLARGEKPLIEVI